MKRPAYAHTTVKSLGMGAMSDYIYIALTALAGFHALTYARWLKKEGNQLGAWGVMALVLAGLALPVYRLVFML